MSGTYEKEKNLPRPKVSALSTDSACPTLLCSQIFSTLLGLGWSGGAEEGHRLPSLCLRVIRVQSAEGQEAEGREKPEHPSLPSLPYHRPFPTISRALVSTIQLFHGVRFHRDCQPLLPLAPSVWGCLPTAPNLRAAPFSLGLSHL